MNYTYNKDANCNPACEIQFKKIKCPRYFVNCIYGIKNRTEKIFKKMTFIVVSPP